MNIISLMTKGLFKDFIYIDNEKTLKLYRDDFITSNFVTTNDKNDKLHTETISNILLNNCFKLNTIHTGRIFNEMNIGKYNKHCNIGKIRKCGFEYIKYIGV